MLIFLFANMSAAMMDGSAFLNHCSVPVKARHINSKTRVKVRGMRRVGNAEKSARLQKEKHIIFSDWTGRLRLLSWLQSRLNEHMLSLPILCCCKTTRWATICSACWSTCPPGCIPFPWTCGVEPCAPGGRSNPPYGEGGNGGEAVSLRSSAASGCGLGSPRPRCRGVRGGRARSWRSAAGTRSCAGTGWSCGGGGGVGSLSGCRRPSWSHHTGQRSGGAGGSPGSRASAGRGTSGGLSHWCCQLECGNAWAYVYTVYGRLKQQPSGRF